MRSLSVWVILLVLLVSVPVHAQSQAHIVHYHCTCHGGEWTQWLQAQAEIFTRENPHITIEILIDPSDYYDKLAILAGAGEFPDVTEVIPAQSIPYLEDGLWMDLTSVIERDPEFDINRFIPITLDLFRWGDGLYGLPASAFTLITSYNADHFQAAGLPMPNDLGDNWNWNSMMDVSRKLVRDTTGDGIPDQFATAIDVSIWRVSYWAENAGGAFFDRYIDPTESRFGTSPVIQAAEFIKSWIDTGIADLDYSDSRARMMAGNVSMLFNQGSTIIGTHREIQGFDMDFAPIPRGPVKGGTEVTANGFQISANSKYPDETWQWVKHLTHNTEAALDHVAKTARVPALFELIPDFVHLSGSNARYVAAWVEEAANPESRIRPLVREGVQIGRLFAPVMRQIVEGTAPAPDALAELDRQVNALLREAHSR